MYLSGSAEEIAREVIATSSDERKAADAKKREAAAAGAAVLLTRGKGTPKFIECLQ